MRSTDAPGRRTERGSSLPLVVGFVLVLLILVAVVVDSSAAYLRRQSLDSLADGAALRGADLGAAGGEAYAGGISGRRLRLTRATVSGAVHAYLRSTGAYGRYPGLRVESVRVDARRRTVEVRLSTPVDLPLTVPGSPSHPRVGATGTASVALDVGTG